MSTEMHAGTDRHRQPPWRVFYRGAEITITSRYVDVDDLRIRIAELYELNRCLTYRYPGVKLAAATGATELGIAVPFAVGYGSLAMLCAGLLSAAGMALGVLADARRNPRYQEIHATLRGRRVVLFGTGDHREFGFVWRALVRAVEAERDTRP